MIVGACATIPEKTPGRSTTSLGFGFSPDGWLSYFVLLLYRASNLHVDNATPFADTLAHDDQE